MLKHYVVIPLLSIVMGGICSGLSAQTDYSEDVKPGVWDDSSNSHKYDYQSSKQHQIAYIDERDADIHERANRKGDWDYKQNWRYNRRAFYAGKTQGEAYDEATPDGVGGIGMDPDTEFLQMRRYYLEQEKRNSQQAEARRQNRHYSTTKDQNHRSQQDLDNHRGQESYGREEVADNYRPASYHPNHNNQSAYHSQQSHQLTQQQLHHHSDTSDYNVSGQQFPYSHE